PPHAGPAPRPSLSAIETPVLHRLRDVCRADCCGALEIGDRARDLEHACIGSRAEAEPGHRAREQHQCRLLRARVLAKLAAAHPRVAFLPIELTGQKPIAPELRREPGTWGEHLRRQRIVRGLLQRDLAVAHGVTTETIYNWENGRAEPEVRYLPRIIDFLGYC